MTWDEVIKSPGFSDLSNQEQAQLRSEWVDKFYVPELQKAKVPEEDIQGARYEAVARFDNGQGYISSFASSAARGLLNTGSAALQGAGVLTGAGNLEDTGREAEEAVNETFNINPVLDKMNFAGSVAGNVGAFIGTAGAGGLVGKSLGAASLGAEAASLGTGFLAGAGQGAQEADQYGITGESRYLRALAGGVAEVASEKLLGGMGSELQAVSRIPGLRSLANGRTGGFTRAIGTEALEEVAANTAGNAATIALAPEGVQTPGLLEGNWEAAAGGALGGAFFGGIGLIQSRSNQVAADAQTALENSGDPEAAAAVAEANAARPSTPRLVPVEAPVLEATPEGDTTTDLEVDLTAPQDIDLADFAENNPVTIEGIEAAAASVEPNVETPEVLPAAEDGTAVPLPVVPGGETAPVAASREEELSQRAEEVFPTPEAPAIDPVAQAQFEEDNRLIDTSGRVNETEALKIFDALRTLGVTSAVAVVNDTGVAPDAGVRRSKGSRRSVNGQDTVFLNRSLVTADTPLHEVVHGLVPEMRQNNAQLYQQGAALLEGTPIMDAIRRRYERGGVPLTGDALMEEAMATVIANNGADLFRRYANNSAIVRQIKEWLAQAKVWLEDFMASKGVDPNMTVEQFAAKVNKRILAGRLRESAAPAADRDVFSLPSNPQNLRPSGLASGQPESRVRALTRTMTYEGNSIEGSVAEAQQIYGENSAMSFADHMAVIDQLKANPGQYQVMTFGAYAGLLGDSLTSAQNDLSQPAAVREAAERDFLTLTNKMKDYASSLGQGVKALDVFLKLANNPAMEVQSVEELAPFFGVQADKDRFDQATAAATRIVTDLAAEGIAATPEADVSRAMEQGLADLAKGEDAYDAGADALDNDPTVAEVEADAEVTESDWFQEALNLLGADVTAVINDLLYERALQQAIEARGTQYSLGGLSSRDELNQRIAAAMAGINSQADAATALRDSKAREKALMTKLSGKRPKKLSRTRPSKADDVQAMVVGRFSQAIDRLINPATANKEDAKKKVVKAITNGLLGKAGLPANFGEGADALVIALGTLISNQEIAASAIGEIHQRLQNDPDTRNALPPDKLAAIMQTAIGKDFETGAPYGERQIAAVLRGELARLDVKLKDVVMDAALTRQTVEQLEAQLRDPDRGVASALSPETLDRVVGAVTAEFRKTAAERAAVLARKAEAKEAAQAQKAVRDAMAAETRAQAEWEKWKARQDERIRRDAERQVRDDMAAEARAAQKWEDEQLKQAERIRRDAEREVRDAMAAEARLIEKDRQYRIALRRKARRDARRAAGREGQALEPLDQEEADAMFRTLRRNEKVIDYLAREFGFDISGLVRVARENDRREGLEGLTLKLADQLGLTRAQTEALLKPVIAQGMKRIDEKRSKLAERQISEAVERLTGKREKKKSNVPTEAQKLMRLAELGGLTKENVELVMQNTRDFQKFSPEFREYLTGLVERANDASLPEQTQDLARFEFLEALRSTRGVGITGLWGEYTMANIFGALNTQKINIFWGFVKTTIDNGIYAGFAGPMAVANQFRKEGKPVPPGLRKTLLRSWLRGFNWELQNQARYILQTGRSKLESDFATSMGNSSFELLGNIPETEIRWTQNGKPLPQSAQKVARGVAKGWKYVRRVMVAADIANRTTSLEMMKTASTMKAVAQHDGPLPTNATDFTRMVENVQYGGSFEQAARESRQQAADEVARGVLPKSEEGVRFGALMDARLGASIGVPSSARTEMLERDNYEVRRVSAANSTEGVLGALTTNLLSLVRDWPGLRYLVPAIRTPINFFSQALDWTPYGFLRWGAASASGRQSSSFSNYLVNRDFSRKNYYKPAYGVTDERIIALRAQALIGTAAMVALLVQMNADLDDDEDDAFLYITGKGPENPEKNKLWREKGYKPFTMRIGGVGVAYQESPFYAMLAPLGAWSDANRYDGMDASKSDKIAYAMTKSISGFKDAVVLRNFMDAIGDSQGGAKSRVESAGKWTSRLASVAVAPRLGSEINTIIWGPQDQKGLSWGEKMFANVPFVPALNNSPALNVFGEEIHVVRGDSAWAEAAPMLAHRIAVPMLDDAQIKFVANIGLNQLTTTRKLKDGSDAKDSYPLMREWQIDSGKKLREWLTPERMAQFDRDLDAAGRDDARLDAVRGRFDKAVRDIREDSLRRISKGRVIFKD